jgi:hypothetical protein
MAHFPLAPGEGGPARPELTDDIGSVGHVNDKPERALGYGLGEGVRESEAEIGGRDAEVILEEVTNSGFTLRQRDDRCQLRWKRAGPKELSNDTGSEACYVRADRDEIAPDRFEVSWVLGLIVGEALFVNLVSLFDPFDDTEQVVGIDALGVEDDDDSADDGVDLRPVHALDVAQCPLHVPGYVLVVRTTDSANLDVRPSIGHPDAPVAPTWVHSVESGANCGPNGIAHGRRYSSRRIANRAEQSNGIHATPRKGSQPEWGCCLPDGELDQPPELCCQGDPLSWVCLG